MNTPNFYEGREQTLIKHFILRHYLERFAHIIGYRWTTITYVDCFSGPWKSRSDKREDTSFAIALEQLRLAQKHLHDHGKSVRMRAMFLEKEKAAHAKLREFTQSVTDIAVETLNSDLAGAIPDVLRFVRAGGQSSFPFFFIDPTGWTGFEMDVIAPLLRFNPGEVVINFMTDFVRRFIEHPDEKLRHQFEALFGAEDVTGRIMALTDAQAREDALVATYAETVQKIGDFKYVCTANVMYPKIDRNYFHLVYATRNRKGVKEFKRVEEKAMEVQETARARAKQRKRIQNSEQGELFAGEDMPHSRPIDEQRQRCLRQSKSKILALLSRSNHVLYDDLWDVSLTSPLVWEADLKQWIRDWQTNYKVRIEGMSAKERVPKLGKGHKLIWQGERE
jgi:three-Cys-motif partner protein